MENLEKGVPFTKTIPELLERHTERAIITRHSILKTKNFSNLGVDRAEWLNKQIKGIVKKVKSEKNPVEKKKYKNNKTFKNWKKKDITFLKENYKTKTDEELATLMERSRQSITAKRSRMKLVKEKHGHLISIFTDFQSNYIKEHLYQNIKFFVDSGFFNNLSESQISSKLYNLRRKNDEQREY